jgi:glycogen synthase kinase 3 beta
VGTEDLVAIKKVLEDRRYKNREIQIMKHLAKHPHPYIVLLRHYFTSKGAKQDEIYINLVMELIPETAFSVIDGYKRRKELTPLPLIKVYMYQLCRAMAHIHGMGICHR